MVLLPRPTCKSDAVVFVIIRMKTWDFVDVMFLPFFRSLRESDVRPFCWYDIYFNFFVCQVEY